MTARPFRPGSIAVVLGAAALLAVAAGAVALVALSRGDTHVRSGEPQTPVVSSARSVAVAVIDNDYEPRDLTVAPGAEVVWAFAGELPHSVTSDDGAFNSGLLEQGERFAVTLDEPRTFAYYCTVHPAMRGRVTVARPLITR